MKQEQIEDRKNNLRSDEENLSPASADSPDLALDSPKMRMHGKSSRKRVSVKQRSPRPQKQEWNDFFHLKKDSQLPKKEYVKMSDRAIVVESRSPPPRGVDVGLNPNLRSRSTMHSTKKAKSVLGTSPFTTVNSKAGLSPSIKYQSEKKSNAAEQ